MSCAVTSTGPKTDGHDKVGGTTPRKKGWLVMVLG